MTLESEFPNLDVVRSALPGAPPMWNELVAEPVEVARERIVEVLAIGGSSALGTVREIGIALPRRARDRKRPRSWCLAVLCDGARCLRFGYPDRERLWVGKPCADEYLRLCTSLGAVSFDRIAGGLLWPCEVAPVSESLMAACDDLPKTPELTAFYSHGTGDYDCWQDGDFFTARCFDHETQELEVVASGGFGKWFEMRWITMSE